MKRLNITLPEEIADKIADIPNKSRFIAEALEEKIEREEQKKLNELLKEGYQEKPDNEEDFQQIWDDTEIEEWI